QLRLEIRVMPIVFVPRSKLLKGSGEVDMGVLEGACMPAVGIGKRALLISALIVAAPGDAALTARANLEPAPHLCQFGAVEYVSRRLPWPYAVGIRGCMRQHLA